MCALNWENRQIPVSQFDSLEFVHTKYDLLDLSVLANYLIYGVLFARFLALPMLLPLCLVSSMNIGSSGPKYLLNTSFYQIIHSKGKA
jgi:hypothetical protein